jgi:hypothetical protein
MGALLRFRRIRDVFRFVIFLRHREHFLHLDRSELFASSGNPVCDRDVVAEVKEQQQGAGDEQDARPSVHLSLLSEHSAYRRGPVQFSLLAQPFLCFEHRNDWMLWKRRNSGRSKVVRLPVSACFAYCSRGRCRVQPAGRGTQNYCGMLLDSDSIAARNQIATALAPGSGYPKTRLPK